jgi:hypothetical protein
MNPPPAQGRIMPACTTARGRQETLMRGRDESTRFAPPPPPMTMRAAAKAAAKER